MRILLIDDNPTVLPTFRLAFQHDGRNVAAFNRAPEALQEFLAQFAGEPYDRVITDFDVAQDGWI